MSRVVVLDNGGHTCKVGFAGEESPRRLVPNLVAKSKADRKTYIGDQLDACKDVSGLQYRLSLEKGYPVNWETQTEVWSRVLGREVLGVSASDCRLMLTVPPLCPPSIAATLDEMVFEHFGFVSCCMMTPQLCAHYAHMHELETKGEAQPCASLVVDCGFSFSHVVPVFDNQVANFGVRRLGVGGKALTNHLKQVISHRQWNVQDETHMINDVKEKMCYVSMHFDEDMHTISGKRTAASSIRREYVMPDYSAVMRGYVKPVEGISAGAPAAAAPGAEDAQVSGGSVEPPPEKRAKAGELAAAASASLPSEGGGDEQVLALAVERFATPEVLFHPSDIGMDEAGIAETIVQSVTATLPDLHEALYSNIVLTGGSTMFPNFKERLFAELRQLVPIDFSLNVRAPAEPIVAAWRGAAHFASSPIFERYSVTKEEYAEHGHSFVRRVCHN